MVAREDFQNCFELLKLKLFKAFSLMHIFVYLAHSLAGRKIVTLKSFLKLKAVSQTCL